MKQTTSIKAGIVVTLVGVMACNSDGLSIGSDDQAVGFGGHGQCQQLNVPVDVGGVPDAQLYVEYCAPPEPLYNGTLIFMVHSTNHNHFSWDPPNQRYSRVRSALNAGFAVVNIDRLGSGQSTLPPSDQVTIDKVITAIHGVVAKLRDGSLVGTTHSSLVWLGSSFGAMYAWQYEAKYPGNFDGFVLNGIQHRIKVSFAQFALGQAIISVCEDPVFSQTMSDCGYIVDAVGFKGPLYYDEANAAPGMISGVNWEARLLRDVVSSNLLIESLAHIGLQPGPEGPQEIPVDVATSDSQKITKPTLLVIGEKDPIYCGGPEGFVCNEANIRALEEPYYSNAPVLDVFVPKDTGHVIPLHRNGPASMDFENQWVLDNVVNR